ncbi:MAG TPA: hypothetical protein VGH33_05325 [Isosphaeraceae bacterium]|jgi:hypothetical protein
MLYEAIPEDDGYDVGGALARGDMDRLRLVALSVAMHSEDPGRAEALCLLLARHDDGIVRGNAILGLGHVARFHRKLISPEASSAVEAALRDPDAWVRGQATCAADDIEAFLGWTLDRS